MAAGGKGDNDTKGEKKRPAYSSPAELEKAAKTSVEQGKADQSSDNDTVLLGNQQILAGLPASAGGTDPRSVGKVLEDAKRRNDGTWGANIEGRSKSTVPVQLPDNRKGDTGDPVTKVQDAKKSADAILGGAGNPQVELREADETARAPDFDAPQASTATGTRVQGDAPAPHYFQEDTDQVFFPDFLVYVCGANVTPHVKGSLNYHQGLNDDINTARIVLDNSHDKFTLTVENIVHNTFNTGADLDASQGFAPYDEGAKEIVYRYKNNQTQHPGNSNVTMAVNTPPSVTGRRYPLSIYGCIFHRMDPVRIWTRFSPFDEWIPAFTGFVQSHPMDDDWTTGAREVTLSCSDIREPMRKMRVQRNSVMFNLPGASQTTDARAFVGVDVNANSANSKLATAEDPTATGEGKAYVDEFWSDLTRGGTAFNFLWVNLSFREISSLMTIGGTVIDLIGGSAGDLDPETKERINQLRNQIEELEFRKTELQQDANQVREQASNRTITQEQLTEKLATVEEAGKNIDRLIRDAQDEINAISGKRVAVGGGSTTINAVGRMTKGQVVRFPAAAINGSKTNQDLNRATLDAWYRLCLFGSPTRDRKPDAKNAIDEKPQTESVANRRYWKLREIIDPLTGAGPRCRPDDLWAPDNQQVHWLLPSAGFDAKGRATNGPSGAENNKIVEQQIAGEGNIAGTRTWTTRADLINEFAAIVDYKWWVTGSGDIVFEFPMYDFEPQDYGPWKNVLTVDGHAKQSTLDEEAGDPPTAVIMVGSFTGRPTDVGEGDLASWHAPPYAMAYLPNMAMRLGVKVESKSHPYSTDKGRLQQLATLELQRQIAFADKSSIKFAWRPLLIPNKAIRFVPRERVALITGVDHSMTVFDACDTTVSLAYTRQLDITGLRRYITGGQQMAVSYATIPGPKDTTIANQVKLRLEETFRLRESFLKASDTKDRLAIIAKESLKFPGGYSRLNELNEPDGLNVLRLAADTATTSRTTSGGTNQGTGSSADDRAQVAISKIAAQSSAAANSNEDLQGVVLAISGVGIVGVDSVFAQSIDTDLSEGVTSPKGQKLGNNARYNWNGVFSAGYGAFKGAEGSGLAAMDLWYLAKVIASESQAVGSTSVAEKIAIGWTVVNAALPAGSASDLSKLSGQKKKNSLIGLIRGKPNAQQQVFRTRVNPAAIDLEVARRILGGEIADPTGGASGLAIIGSENVLEDERACNIIESEVSFVTVENARGADGEALRDRSTRHVFLKRNDKQADAVTLKEDDPEFDIKLNIPAPYNQYADAVFEASEIVGLSPSLLFTLLEIESHGNRSGREKNINFTGDTGALGLNWSHWDARLLTPFDAEIKSQLGPLAGRPTGEKKTSGGKPVWREADGTVVYGKTACLCSKKGSCFFGRANTNDICRMAGAGDCVYSGGRYRCRKPGRSTAIPVIWSIRHGGTGPVVEVTNSEIEALPVFKEFISGRKYVIAGGGRVLLLTMNATGNAGTKWGGNAEFDELARKIKEESPSLNRPMDANRLFRSLAGYNSGSAASAADPDSATYSKNYGTSALGALRRWHNRLSANSINLTRQCVDGNKQVQELVTSGINESGLSTRLQDLLRQSTSGKDTVDSSYDERTDGGDARFTEDNPDPQNTGDGGR